MGTVHVFGLSFLILCLFYVSIAEAKGGFSLDLIRRDSPKSPYYNPDETHYQRLTKAMQRSVNRISHFDPSVIAPNAAEGDIIGDMGEYLMKISLGTPPVEVLAIADTGSDLIWTQCQPCTQCYRQKAPLFDPSQSSTYKNVDCESQKCTAFHGSGCLGSHTCGYKISYGDGSYSRGNIAVDTVTLGSTDGQPAVFPNVVIGCGHSVAGTFKPDGSGIIGLGRGNVSLPSQMGSSIEGKFSYCLVPIGSHANSKINFGNNAVVSGSGVATTPMVEGKSGFFYYLTLDAISVGSNKIPYSVSSSEAPTANIIIDSGTTLTMLPREFLTRLTKAVSAAIEVTPVRDPSGILDLCYPYSSDFKAPRLTVHFRDADVELDINNTFLRVSDRIVCFTFRGSDQFSIYGNLAQMNFLVGYDTQKKTLSFKRTDCTK